MSSIKISELRPAGSELFQDSESFLNELNDGHEMEHVLGGGHKKGGFFGSIGISITAQTNVGNTVNANTVGNVNTVLVY